MTDASKTTSLGGGPSYSLPEAAALIGCHRITLNYHVLAERLSATRDAAGHWYLDEAGLAQARRMVRPQPRHNGVCTTCLRVGELLATWGNGNVAELTSIVAIHEGNVRKHLAHLAQAGHAVRRFEGDWALTPEGHTWIAGRLKTERPEHPVIPVDVGPADPDSCEEVIAPG